MGEGRPVAIVTGGRQGLGLGAARALAVAGFDIAVADVVAPDEVSEHVVGDLEGRGYVARYYQLDLADLEAHAAFVRQVVADFGRIDCLLNNAGIAARPLTDILDLGPEAFDRAVDINLRGTFFLSQHVAKHMIGAPTDHYRCIINVTSIAAELVSVERAQYCMTKAALSSFTKILAVRLAREGIFVHEVRPGFMQTAMTASAGTTVIDEWIETGRVPVPRWGSPEDVGTTVATLASGRLPYTTGQPFWVAGGLNIPQAT